MDHSRSPSPVGNILQVLLDTYDEFLAEYEKTEIEAALASSIETPPQLSPIFIARDSPSLVPEKEERIPSPENSAPMLEKEATEEEINLEKQRLHKRREGRSWYQAYLNAVEGTNYIVDCLDSTHIKHKGGRKPKRSRGKNAKQNNAQREYERVHRNIAAPIQKQELKNLCSIMAAAKSVGETRVNIEGTIFKKDLILDVAECLANSVCKEDAQEFKKLRTATFKPASHKAKRF